MRRKSRKPLPDEWNIYWEIRIRISKLYAANLRQVTENVNFVWASQRWRTLNTYEGAYGSSQVTVVNSEILEVSNLHFKQIFYCVLDAVWSGNRYNCFVEMKGIQYVDGEQEEFYKESTVWDYTNWQLGNRRMRKKS